MASLNQQLDALWESPDTPIIDAETGKFLVISDIHMGNRGKADDFRINAATVTQVLTRYQKEGYGLVLLGDIEELWQFDLPEILDTYGRTVYEAIKSFGHDRVWRVYGNHDLDWKVHSTSPPWMDGDKPKKATEALKLRTAEGEVMLLVHGHQGTQDSDKLSWIGRPLVRLYRLAENLGINLFDPTPDATKSVVTKDFERKRYNWAKSRRRIILCGHSHRAIFASISRPKQIEEEIRRLQNSIANETSVVAKKTMISQLHALLLELQDERKKGRDIESFGKRPLPVYFNSGCCLYSSGITTIEIENDRIELVKWTQGRSPKREWTVAENLSDIVSRVR